jgi:biotin carboxyl carrier protein
MYLKGEAKVNGIRWAADAKPATKSDGPVSVTVEGKTYEVSFENDSTAVVNGKRYTVGTAAAAGKSATPAQTAGAGATVAAPVPGAVLRFSVKEGDRVSEGQEILVMEAMKMETPVAAPAAGTVHFVVKQGDQVQTGNPLAEIK